MKKILNLFFILSAIFFIACKANYVTIVNFGESPSPTSTPTPSSSLSASAGAQ